MAISSSTSTSSSAPSPASPARVFGCLDHASLWFSLGVGLLVMQVGAYLVPALSVPQALAVIAGGSALGAGLLAWVAAIGCRHGMSTAELIGASLGRRFAMLPVGLNIVQLLGWTAFELVVMREGTVEITRQLSGIALSPLVATLLWGALLVALAAGSMLTLVRRFVSRLGLPLVLLSLCWISWQFGQRIAAQPQWWQRPGDGSMSLLAALDLVIAMPVSWLPLVADYARHGRTPGGALRGTWIGYLLANVWCYGLGVVIVSSMPAGTDLVAALLLAQGGLIAFGLILIDETDNAYGDVHSGAVSLNFLQRRWSVRAAGMTVAALATGCALALPMHSLEPFLLMLSSIFVPLFGVVLSQWTGRATPPATQDWKAGPALTWALGIGAYHLAAQLKPEWGSALPSLALTLLLGSALRLRAEKREKALSRVAAA